MADFRPYGTDKKLDEIVDSGNWEDRKEMVVDGYGLDKLIDDEEHYVRCTVVRQGYGLNKLVNDKDWRVRNVVKWYLEENGYKNVEEWAKDNPDKIYHKDGRTKGEER